MKDKREANKWVDPKSPIADTDTPTTRNPEASPPDDEAALRVYLDLLNSRLNCLEFGDPSELLQSSYGLRGSMSRLEDIWVPPLLREVPFGYTNPPDQQQAALEVSLDRALAKPSRVYVFLAQPGGGKSTVCRFLACKMSSVLPRSEADPVPIYLPARFLRLGESGIDDAVVSAALEQLGSSANSEPVRSAVRRSLPRAFVIIDGLDEVPIGPDGQVGIETTRARVVQVVRYLFATYKALRCLITCREADYVLDRQSILSEANHFSIGGLSPVQVQTAITRWHTAAEIAARHVASAPAIDWQQRAMEVRELIRADAEIGAIASVPLFLNMLQVVYSPAKEAPRSISQLCDRAIRFLLYEKPRLRSDRAKAPAGGGARIEFLWHPQSSEWLSRILQELAYQIQKRSLEGGSRGVTLQEIHAVALTVVDVKARDISESGHLALSAVEHVVQGNGVLAEESGRWDFTHNIFREVLAGQALQRYDITQRVTLAKTHGWLLPLRYWAGYVALSEAGIGEIFVMAAELRQRALRSKRDRVNYILAAAEIMCEVNSVSETVEVLSKLKEKVRRDLIRLLENRKLPLALRVRAGDLLGSLGDPRLGKSFVEAEFVRIPSRTYTVGRNTPHTVLNKKYDECPASPCVVGDMRDFRIALFPVTNRDYAAFIADGGYEDSRYYCSKDSAHWFRGDAGFMQELASRVDQTALKHFMTELTAGRVSDLELVELRDRILKRNAPLYWYDPRFNRPNQPVVGINWWEAMAFCRWAETKLRAVGVLQTGESVTLPTEVQWECAAKGPDDSAPHPWGTAGPEDNAHVRTSKSIARTCGVGLFPWARCAGGPLDIVGNVWEWTRSVPGVLKGASFRNVPSTDGNSDRVVRGSSWLSTEPESASITFRSFDPPCNAYEDLGFRIAIVAQE